MTTRDQNPATPSPESLDPAERDDWTRYGVSHLPVPDPSEHHLERPKVAGSSTLSKLKAAPAPVVARKTESPDEEFLDYRHEGGAAETGPDTRRRSPHFVANVATVSVVGAAGLIALVLAVVSSALMPATSPTPTRDASLLVASSLGPGSSATVRIAHEGIGINLPLTITIPDRDQSPDDGTTIYLTGPTGGAAIDPGTGSIPQVYGGGPAFADGVRRAVILGNGIWVSAWPTATAGCGPSCWASATTYRVDITTKFVTNTLAATYLLGSTSEGIWVATAGQIERLNPINGQEAQPRIPWKSNAEPRVGCEELWAFTPSGQSANLAQIDPATGDILGQSTLDPTVTYGPTNEEGQCWMMSGSAGVSTGNTKLVWLNADGTTVKVSDYPGKSIVALNREFWQYTSDGRIQRFEAVSGITYGVPWVLPIRPPDNDPKWLFSATNTLWMIDGTELYGFDVPTGANRVNG
jgi:hypothetical protein